jgi:membrane peptidoglycan carboxypeptidase
VDRRSARPSRATVRRSATAAQAAPRRFWNYPRPGYHGLHRWLPSWRFVLSSVLGFGFLGLGVFFAAYLSVDIPPANAEVAYQSTKVYFAPEEPGAEHGELMGTYPGMNREIVDYGSLPEYVGEAVVASEDRTFFTNPGVDIRGIARALLNNLMGGSRQGASTLTQQYVERYYVGTTTDYLGKAKEAILALKISQQESKHEILGRYLNTIYFGRGAYGIQAAAQAYFGVDAKDLTVSQSAMLAGIIPSPSNWDPAIDQSKAEQRWDRTLSIMIEDGWITASERAGLEFPETITVEPSSVYGGPNGYLMVMARSEVAEQLGMSEDDVMRAGYAIVTTVHKPIQDEAIRAADEMMSGAMSNGSTPSPNLKIAMVTLNPATGGILALYSGADFVSDQINRVTTDQIQAGSTYKPFCLIAALEQGVSLKSMYDSSSPQSIPGWRNADGSSKVVNFEGESFGQINLVQATAASVNTVYARLNLQVGPEATAEVATTAGVTTTQNLTPSNVLGSDSVHVLDMASAYGVIAAQGMRSKPHVVGQVINAGGSVAYTGGSTPVRVFDAGVMADATYAMEGVVEQKIGSGHKYISPLHRHIAGKTGTSTNNKSAWFIGFTPDIVTAVALSQVGDNGRDQDSITPWGRSGQVTGGKWPAALWANYMKPVLAMDGYSDNTDFPHPVFGGKAPTPTATPTPTVTETATQAPTTVLVPDGLAKKLEADAEAAVLAAGLHPRIVSESSLLVQPGRVIRTEPSGGTEVEYGSTVTIVVSSGAPTPTETPPEPPGPEPDQGQGLGRPGGGG